MFNLACHQRGVIHRDIKDENLLVTISPHSKPKIELIDFGSGAHIGVNEIYFDFDGKFHNNNIHITIYFPKNILLQIQKRHEEIIF